MLGVKQEKAEFFRDFFKKILNFYEERTRNRNEKPLKFFSFCDLYICMHHFITIKMYHKRHYKSREKCTKFDTMAKTVIHA